MKNFPGLVTNILPGEPLGAQNLRDYDQGRPFSLNLEKLNNLIDYHKRKETKDVVAVFVKHASEARAISQYRNWPTEIDIFVDQSRLSNYMVVHTDKTKAQRKLKDIMRLTKKAIPKQTPIKGSTIGFNHG